VAGFWVGRIGKEERMGEKTVGMMTTKKWKLQQGQGEGKTRSCMVGGRRAGEAGGKKGARTGPGRGKLLQYTLQPPGGPDRSPSRWWDAITGLIGGDVVLNAVWTMPSEKWEGRRKWEGAYQEEFIRNTQMGRRTAFSGWIVSRKMFLATEPKDVLHKESKTRKRLLS